MKKSLFTHIFLFIITFSMNVPHLLAMGAPEKPSGPLGPSFISLEEGEPSFQATITDGTTSYHVKDLGFGGLTTLKHIRKETDDSSNDLDLAHIALIEIETQNHNSKKHADAEFTLVHITMKNGVKVKNFLIPRLTNVSGIEIRSGIQKGWFINKLNKISINHTR